MVLFALSLFSSSPPPVRMRKPAYMIIITVIRAIKPFINTIILAMIQRVPAVSKTRLVQSVATPKILLHQQLPQPYAIFTIGSAIIMMIKPITDPINIFLPLAAHSSSPMDVTIR